MEVKRDIESYTMGKGGFELTTAFPLYKGAKYELQISEVVDGNENSVYDLSAEMIGIEKEIIESDDFLISYIEPISTDLVVVHFTQPVENTSLLPLMYQFGLKDQVKTEGE